MPNKIIERINKNCGVPNLLEILSEKISLSDLQSLLLEVYRKRSFALSPVDLLRQYKNNRFVQPASISRADLCNFDLMILEILPGTWEMIELSPLAPLGTNSAVAAIDQNNVVTTIRNTDVCSDNTNVLALECSLRRKKLLKKNPRSLQKICLASSHRVVRPQIFDEAVSFAHFQLFGLCTAGRDQGSFGFESESLIEHIDFYIKLIHKAKEQGYIYSKVKIILTALHEIRLAALESIIQQCASEDPVISFQVDQQRQSGGGYYSEAAFQIWMSDTKDQEYLIVDGGFTDWTQKLLANRKERLLISGMGSERFIHCFQSK
jgi:hypothetical protein